MDFVRNHMKMSSASRFIFIQFKLISFERFCRKTRFETEAQDSSEVAHCYELPFSSVFV